MPDKGLNEKPVRLIAFALLVKVNLLGPEGRCSFLSVRCFNHRDNTVSAGQPCSALTRRNLLNAPHKEGVAFLRLLAVFRRVCLPRWDFRGICRRNVVGLQLTVPEWATKTSVAFSSTPLLPSLKTAAPSRRLTCGKVWGAPHTLLHSWPCSRHLRRGHKPWQGMCRSMIYFLRVWRERTMGDTNKKIHENLDSSAEKGHVDAQLWAMSTLIGFVLIAEVWTVGTKCPAVPVHPPQAWFICGLLLFSTNFKDKKKSYTYASVKNECCILTSKHGEWFNPTLSL